MNLSHLDDPDGFTPDDAFRQGARREGRRRRSRRRRTLLAGSGVATISLFFLAVAVYGAVRASSVDRVELDLAAPPVQIDEPYNLLVIGTDRGVDVERGRSHRADSVTVLRILPVEGVVRVVTLPRDLLVDPSRVVGHEGGPMRLNETYAVGGAQGLVEVVEGSLGIPVNGYVEFGFAAVIDLVDLAGGVDLAVPVALRDPRVGLDLAASPCTRVDGTTVLKLLRSRNLETQGLDGAWTVDVTGDLGRIGRQNQVLAAISPQLPRAIDGVGGLAQALEVATDHLTVDARLGITDAMGLARWWVEGPPAVEWIALPVEPAWLGAAAVLHLGDAAGEVVAAVGGSLPPDATRGGDESPAPAPPASNEPVAAAGGFTCR